MKFPVYPERLRRRSMITRKFAKISFIPFVCSIPIVLVGSMRYNDNCVFVGIWLFIVFGVLSLSSITARDELLFVEIGEDDIRVADIQGDVLQRAEYREIRHLEVREIEITLISHAAIGSRCHPSSGIREKIILAYVRDAVCFEDLKLKQLGTGRHACYWCDEVFYHRQCIAVSYDEEVWRLLQAKVECA